MASEMAGAVAFITGGGRGIGRAMAQALAAEGAAVAVAARSRDQVDATVKLVQDAGGRAFGTTLDVTDWEAVQRAVQETEAALGPITVLVNNAGTAEAGGPVWEADPKDWWDTVAVNLLGTFLCSRAVLPGMVARGRGRIINLNGGGSAYPQPGFTAYASAKAGILRFTDSLAEEAKEHGISVFAIMPGLVQTAMGEKAKAKVARARNAPWTPVERPAQVCLFLASGKADALSGRALGVGDDLPALVARAAEIQANDTHQLRMKV